MASARAWTWGAGGGGAGAEADEVFGLGGLRLGGVGVWSVVWIAVCGRGAGADAGVVG